MKGVGRLSVLSLQLFCESKILQNKKALHTLDNCLGDILTLASLKKIFQGQRSRWWSRTWSSPPSTNT